MDFNKASVPEIAATLATMYNLPKAEKYDLFLRDDVVEIIGFVPDPTYDIKDFVGREMLFPKRWVTLGIVNQSTIINSN